MRGHKLRLNQATVQMPGLNLWQFKRGGIFRSLSNAKPAGADSGRDRMKYNVTIRILGASETLLNNALRTMHLHCTFTRSPQRG